MKLLRRDVIALFSFAGCSAQQSKERALTRASGSRDEVPRMTSDIYYGFGSKPFRDSLQLPLKPVRDKWFGPSYSIEGDGLGFVKLTHERLRSPQDVSSETTIGYYIWFHTVWADC